MREKEIIEFKIKDGKGGQKLVSARELHEKLMVKTKFVDWIKGRIKKYEFIENTDFIAVSEKKETAQGNLSTFRDYAITLDMAKELSMLENNEQGKKCRKYFIEKEKELRLLQNPVQQYLNMSEEDRAIAYFTSLKEKKALAEKNNALTEENKQKDQIIGELKPKADYTDVILKSDGLVTISQIAKDYGMSGRKLNGLLHDWKIQFKQGNTWLLYAKYQSKGYTKSYTYYDTINNESRLMTKWTQKGRLFLNDILNKNGIYATIEIN